MHPGKSRVQTCFDTEEFSGELVKITPKVQVSGKIAKTTQKEFFLFSVLLSFVTDFSQLACHSLHIKMAIAF